MLQPISLINTAKVILEAKDANYKVQETRKLYMDFLKDKTKLEKNSVKEGLKVGFPSNLNWVSPKKLKNRKIGSIEGRCILMHAISHIEFNAINLALDAICRFDNMPDHYYEDWLRVAVEEAYHFQLLSEYLNRFGYQYGDFPVHDGLWQMALDTRYDVLARMACVPRLMEARGLDIAPIMSQKLSQVGDTLGAEILNIIFHDEKSHVKIGNYWYRYLCQQRCIDPMQTFIELVNKHASDYLRGPYNINARLEAGFLSSEMDWIRDYERTEITTGMG